MYTNSPGLPIGPFPSSFPLKPYVLLYPPYLCHMNYPSPPPYCDHPNNIWRGVKIVNRLIINPLNTKRRLLYLKTQFVPRCCAMY